MENQAHPDFRFAKVVPQGMEWTLKRNCAVTPTQLAGFYGLICAGSLLVAGFFWWQGAVLVLPFAVLELLVVGVAFGVYARHATDCERIVVSGGRLVVQWESAGRVSRSEWPSTWVRVEPVGSDGALIGLSVAGQQVCVGRYLRAEWRPQLAREIRTALRTV
jgi:uncharacterized membrane protein